MHRFTTNETKYDKTGSKKKPWYLLALLMVVVFYLLVSSVSSSTVSRQKESLEKALNRDIIHCYAVEGYYPPSLDYLKEHYGLSYDEELFSVDYHPIASNIKPNYTILLTSK